MRMFNLPIILGYYDKADKCGVAVKDSKLGGMSLFICRLKKPQERGTKVCRENIGGIICQLHFCKLETARAFRNSMIKLVEQWEADE